MTWDKLVCCNGLVKTECNDKVIQDNGTELRNSGLDEAFTGPALDQLQCNYHMLYCRTASFTRHWANHASSMACFIVGPHSSY